MKHYKKGLAIILCIILAVSGAITLFTPVYAAAGESRPFTPRLTAPDADDPRFSTSNPFHLVGNRMPNCTTYAWGRAYEILGHPPALNRGHARYWFTNTGPFRNPNDRYERGQVPRIGAIAVWGTDVGSGFGHVSVVEYVFPNGSFKTSGSVWLGAFFYTSIHHSLPASFQGFIYLGCFVYTPAPIPVRPDTPVVYTVPMDRTSDANDAPLMIGNLVNLRGLQEVLDGTMISEINLFSGRRMTLFALPHASGASVVFYIYQGMASILLGDFIIEADPYELKRVDGSWYLTLDAMSSLLGFTGFVEGDYLYLHMNE